MASSALALEVPRFVQPDDVTCGPTCLRQVAHFYGQSLSHDEVLAMTRRNEDGGTLGVFLGLCGLRLGFRARIYPYNLRVFDPAWFSLPAGALRDKLGRRAAVVPGRKLRGAIDAYASFLDSGGEICFAEMQPELLTSILDRGHPIISGLSATYLYQSPRERPADNEPDDIAGEPVGHFVTITGYSDHGRAFLVTDPEPSAPFSVDGRYHVPARRLLNAILLGDVTYDAVLLELECPNQAP
jgi:hypothetical protein